MTAILFYLNIYTFTDMDDRFVLNKFVGCFYLQKYLKLHNMYHIISEIYINSYYDVLLLNFPHVPSALISTV